MTQRLRRYTNALALIDMLRSNRLRLLSPSSWFDQNDALGLELYSKLRGDGSIYAICMAKGPEQAHHWQLFASGNYGLCIIIDQEKLENHLRTLRGSLLFGAVKYRNLQQVAQMSPVAQEVLPFLKRDTFKAEDEYRILAWEDSIFAEPTYTIPFPAQLIERVVFGPAMPDGFVELLLEIGRERDELQHISFARSRLVNNASWGRAISHGLGR